MYTYGPITLGCILYNLLSEHRGGWISCNASGLNLTFVLAAEGKTQLFLID